MPFGHRRANMDNDKTVTHICSPLSTTPQAINYFYKLKAIKPVSASLTFNIQKRGLLTR